MERRDLPIATGPRGIPVDPGTVGLSGAEAAVRRAAFRSITKGTAAGADELTTATGLDSRTVEKAVRSLVQRGEAVVDHAGRVVGSAGLSLLPSRHGLVLEEEELHTWCAIDAVGIPAALGANAVARTTCPTCRRRIEVSLRAGRATDHAELRAWLPRLDCCTSVVDELCPDMNLFCNDEHLEEWRRQAGEPPGVVLSLVAMEELGRNWWGDLA